MEEENFRVMRWLDKVLNGPFYSRTVSVSSPAIIPNNRWRLESTFEALRCVQQITNPPGRGRPVLPAAQ
eukprot:3468597-Pyramimonas_sp.AAC.1